MRVFLPTTLALFLLVPLGAPPARARPVSKTDLGRIQVMARHYVREADAEARGALFVPVASAARRLDFEQVAAVVRGAVPGKNMDRGFTHGVPFEALGETWTYSVHAPPGKRKGLLPLVVDPGHASLKDATEAEIEDVMKTWLDVSGAADDVIYIRTRVLDRLSVDGRYEAWTVPPRRAQGKPSLDTVADVLLAAIGDACLRYPVNPDRVIVHGISQTGYWAWWLGTFAPDRFAAVVPVSSVTWHVMKRLQNLANTNVIVLHGTADPTCPFAQAKGAVEALEKLEAPVEFTAVEGGLHVQGVFPRWKDLWPKVAETQRKAYPQAFRHAYVSPTRPHAFWVQARDMTPGEFNPWGGTGTVDARIDGQTIHVEAKGMRGLTVFLAPRMLDLGKQITIRVNDERVFFGTVKPDLRRALDVARERGDGAPFVAAVEVEVP